MLLVSGLGLGGGGGESLLGTQLLVDVVTGQLGDEGEQCSAACVSRVILAGNLLSPSTQSRDSINKVAPATPSCLCLGLCNYCAPISSELGILMPLRFNSQAKYLTKKTQAASVEAVKMLDEILLQLSVSSGGWRGQGDPQAAELPCKPSRLCALQASVPVDVMPGEFDPTNYTLPQQPLHPCMLPLATAYSTLQLVTNPYQATIDGVR